jgi:hypothetical protein
MRLPRIHRPRYADVAATLALLLAMGGTAYAVTSLPKNSVGTKQLQTAAVTASKLKDGGVTNAKLANHSVSAAKLKDNNVTNAKLADGSVDTAKLGDGSVSNAKLGDGSVTSSKLADGSVSNFKIAAGSVTHSKLGSSSIDGSNIAANSVSLADIVGADAHGGISFSVGANACSSLNLGVSGAVVGQGGLLSVTTGTLPAHIVVGPLQVTAANTMKMTACNISGTSFSVSGLGVRIITFG